jgi:transposase
MFIKKVKKKNQGFDKEFTYLHLVESVRTSNGPRQKLILNLGAIDIDESKFSELAECIESLLKDSDQTRIFPFDEDLVALAKQYSDKILNKNSHLENEEPHQLTNCDLTTLAASSARSIGAEHVANETWNLLDLNQVLISLELTESQISLCKRQVIGRICKPGSDLSTWDWLENRSGLNDIDVPPDKRSLSSFYRAADLLLQSKNVIETHLNKKESNLFNLPKKLCLFDLTNTFLEGKALANSSAKFGRSKEKRSDCKLLTLGLMIDEFGFPKKTMFFDGNVGEPKTLKDMITELLKDNPYDNENKPYIVIDAGIADTENLQYLREIGFKYVVVSRSKKDCSLKMKDLEDLMITNSGSVIRAKKEIVDQEALLLCHSDQKEAKENAMMLAKETKLIAELEKLKERIGKQKSGLPYNKLLERVGRLREKYAYAAKEYDIDVIPDESKEKVVDLQWTKRLHREHREAGCYLIRTNDLNLNEKEIWDIYHLLVRVEGSFKSMKSDLGLRPVHHQTEERSDAHLFITVLAYHIITSIEYQLRAKGDNRSWASIREALSNHMALSVNLQVEEQGQRFLKNIRLCTNPDPAHLEIYSALGIPTVPFQRKIKNIKL